MCFEKKKKLNIYFVNMSDSEYEQRDMNKPNAVWITYNTKQIAAK
jgi:hypothetical protein